MIVMVLLLLADVFIAFILDIILGDPRGLPHPVRFIGWLVKKGEDALRTHISNTSTKKVECWGEDMVHNSKALIARKERNAGILLTVCVVVFTFTLVFAILRVACLVHPILFHVINIYLLYTSFAAKCLADEAYKVFDALKERDIFLARKMLSMIVGRKTEDLDEPQIVRGTVETVAENTVDGVVSPLFYAILGSIFGLGAPLAYAYKAVNTLDSMVGYMNEKYMHFGTASAKLDDAANFIPARLSGLLIPLSAFFGKKNYKKSFEIMLRDRKNHKSPNSAYPEAAVAGALGIMLGGTNTYFGEQVEKPTIGDNEKELEMRDISDTIKLMFYTSFLSLLGFSVIAVLVTSIVALIYSLL